MPDGAPQRAKEGALPPPEQDVKYSYLWNCRGAPGITVVEALQYKGMLQLEFPSMLQLTRRLCCCLKLCGAQYP